MRLSIFNFKPIRLVVIFLVGMVIAAGWLKMRVLEKISVPSKEKTRAILPRPENERMRHAKGPIKAWSPKG